MEPVVVALLVAWVATASGAIGLLLRSRARAGSARGAAPGGELTSVAGVDALRAELRHVVELVHELDAAGAQRFGAVDARLEQATRTSRDLAQATAGLREALASSRARGQWGERLCDDVLRAAGLVEGVSYVRQRGEGGGRPDVTFLLPGDRRLHLDVKFPLDNFLRHVEADDELVADAARAAFVRDVRDRVRELAGRAYVDPASGTLGYCLLFVPNEQVYAFAHESDAGLIDDALARRVVLCSPLTLFAVLAVVREAVDAHAVEQRSGEVLEALLRFEAQWGRFGDELDRLGRALTTANRAFETLDTTRRRGLQRELDRVADLRAGLAPTAAQQ